MSLHDNAYASFMLDYAAGLLAPAERLVGDLHRSLSPEGCRNARLLEALGGTMLEGLSPFEGDMLDAGRPGERAPAHSHGRRDVTVVLRGAYADDFGVYERGDLAFAEPGMSHEPRAVGEETCVCLLATEAGRPIRGFIGLFGWGVRKLKEDA